MKPVIFCFTKIKIFHNIYTILDRRRFLATGAAAAFTTTPLGVLAKPTCDADEPSADAREILERQQHIPEALKDVNFWGHRIKPIDDNFRVDLGYVVPAVSLRNAAAEMRWRTHKRTVALECGKYRLREADLSVSEQEHVQRLKIAFEELRDRFHNMPEQDRFYNIVEVISSSLRDTRYLDEGLGNTDPLKTLPQLFSDGLGDCEDFAFGRYTIARELGLNPDHMALMIYGHRDVNIGHCNLAVFDPYKNTWLVIDGTGRTDKQALGSTTIYENSQVIMNIFRKNGSYKAGMVPYCAVTHKGIATFDCHDQDGQWKSAQPIPTKPNHKPLLVIQDAMSPEELATLRGLPYLHPDF